MFDLVKDFRECGELEPFQFFIKNFSASQRIIDSVVVAAVMRVHVVVPQDTVSARDPCDVAILFSANLEYPTNLVQLKHLVNFQDDATVTIDLARQENTIRRDGDKLEAVWFGVVYETVRSKSFIMDDSVAVPGVPVVGVRALRYSST